MKKILVAALLSVVGLLGGWAPQAHAGYGWQAIYYSPGFAYIGKAWNYPTANSAMTAARNHCGYYDCYLIDVSAGCVTFATQSVCP